MQERTIVVLGGGVAGLAASLLLARDGHTVTLLERDPLDAGDPLDAVDWPRRGLPHFQLPHAFIPRGRLELIRLLPDVYEALIDNGARDVDCRPKLPGEPRPGDEELCYLAVRRPLLEWALRRAVAAEPAVAVRAPVTVRALAVEGQRVCGVIDDTGMIDADLVVDAMGRRSATGRWLADAGLDPGEPQTSDCGVVYYCRYYRQHPGFELPDGPWLLSPRGDLGYCAYATFPGDNGAFAALLAVPKGVPSWRALNDPAMFEAAVARIPPLRAWVDPSGCEPITDVKAMAGLRNSLRPPATVPGLVPVGDAVGHTDPVLAHGLAFALIHAAALTTAVTDNDDMAAAGADYDGAVRPELQERFDFVTALDEQRLRMWRGEPVDFAHRDGDYALFTMAAAGAAGVVDADVARVFARRIGLLDRTAVLDRDVAMQEHIEKIFAALSAVPRPAAGPPAEEMLSLVSAHG